MFHTVGSSEMFWKRRGSADHRRISGCGEGAWMGGARRVLEQ